MLCCICNEEIEVHANGWTEGHNAQPVTEGRCCDVCHTTHVIYARIMKIEESE